MRRPLSCYTSSKITVTWHRLSWIANNHLARPKNLPGGLGYTFCLCWIVSFKSDFWRPIISGSILDGFFTVFFIKCIYLVVDYISDPFFYPLRDVMAINFGAKFANQTLCGTVSLQNALKYCDIDERIGSADYTFTCGELFWSSNPRDYDSRNFNCFDDVKKISIFPRVSQKVGLLDRSLPIFFCW